MDCIIEEDKQDIEIIHSGPKQNLEDIDKQLSKVSKEIELLTRKKTELLRQREKIKEALHLKKSAKIANKDWDREDFLWSEKLKMILSDTFKIKSLRPYQLPTINATMSGYDSILIMPTGGGKSLCYQLPALLTNGITLVVSPLISLMEDQLFALDTLGIPAKMLCASSTKEEVNFVHNAMVDPKSKLKLLYVTPEKLAKSKRFMAKLQKMHQFRRFARLAIDEVHCCSQWGHDFRPDYKFLGIMRKMFPGTPILGLTATATSKVVTDVQKILNIQGCLVLKASFNRPNLYYEVHTKPNSQKECVEVLKKLLLEEFNGLSGIIYTLSIKDTQQLASELCTLGVKVAPYHAELSPEKRSKIHRMWLNNEYQAVIATIAFGMGIDKPDVRFIIHHCISKSMENFYQESGRAGRDDLQAKCIVFWRFGDFFRLSTMVFTEQTGLENLYSMASYCLSVKRCRRELIADHFGERWDSSNCHGMCDFCNSSADTKVIDLKSYSQQLLKIILIASKMDQRLTGLKLLDAWLGKGPKNLRSSDTVCSEISREMTENIIVHLLIDGFLREDFHFTPYSTISYIVMGPKAEEDLSPTPISILSEPKKGFKTKIDSSSLHIPKNTCSSENVYPSKKPRYFVVEDD